MTEHMAWVIYSADVTAARKLTGGTAVRAAAIKAADNRYRINRLAAIAGTQ